MEINSYFLGFFIGIIVFTLIKITNIEITSIFSLAELLIIILGMILIIMINIIQKLLRERTSPYLNKESTKC